MVNDPNRTPNPPRTSVIIPVYNREEPVLRAIDSVLQQSDPDFEVIVVDDASTDNTPEAVTGIGDSRVRLLRHTTNQFAAAARNTGMQHASGEYIAFLDSDDAWRPDKLARQIELLERNPDAGFCISGVLMRQGRGYREKTVLPKLHASDSRRDLLFRYMTGRIQMITSTTVLRKSLREQIGLMDLSLRRNQDVDFFIRMIGQARPISLEEPLVDFFPNATPPPLDLVAQSNQTLLNKHAETLRNLGRFRAKRIHAYFRFIHGKRHLERGELGTGVRLLVQGMGTSPFIPARLYASAGHKLLKRVMPG